MSSLTTVSSDTTLINTQVKIRYKWLAKQERSNPTRISIPLVDPMHIISGGRKTGGVCHQSLRLPDDDVNREQISSSKYVNPVGRSCYLFCASSQSRIGKVNFYFFD